MKKAGTFWINLSHDRGEQKQKHSRRFEIESVKADLQLHSWVFGFQNSAGNLR